MKAISLKEPWATLMAEGKKTIETRTWSTAYRGPLLIVGSKNPPGKYAGKAACIVDLYDCDTMLLADEAAACCPVYPGAYAWFTRDIQPVEPVAIRGRLGLYEVPDEIIKLTGKPVDFRT